MKRWYAGYCCYGVNTSYDSSCWIVYAYNSKSERDKDVYDSNLSHFRLYGGLDVMEAIDYKTAERILGRNTNRNHWVVDESGFISIECI